MFHLPKPKNQHFTCLQDHWPYKGQGEGCALSWAEASLRPENVKAFHSFPTTHQIPVSSSHSLEYELLYMVLEVSILLHLYVVNMNIKNTMSKTNSTNKFTRSFAAGYKNPSEESSSFVIMETPKSPLNTVAVKKHYVPNTLTI